MSLSEELNRRSQGHQLPRQNVNFLIFSKTGNIFLIHRFDRKQAKNLNLPPEDDRVEKWFDLPGGRVDHPENHLSAMVRENNEELGIRINAALPLTTMENPTPNCMEGSTRSIYVITDYSGTPYDKAGLAEGHLALKEVSPADAVTMLKCKIDDETRDFLSRMAQDFFTKFCHSTTAQSANMASKPQNAPA